MKKFIKAILLVIVISSVCTGCKGMGKYADDAYRGVKKAVNEYKPKPPRHLSVPKDCPYCENGYYWYNGYQFQCGHCEGKGIVLERVY